MIRVASACTLTGVASARTLPHEMASSAVQAHRAVAQSGEAGLQSSYSEIHTEISWRSTSF